MFPVFYLLERITLLQAEHNKRTVLKNISQFLIFKLDTFITLQRGSSCCDKEGNAGIKGFTQSRNEWAGERRQTGSGKGDKEGVRGQAEELFNMEAVRLGYFI